MTEVLTKMSLYHFHERLWANISWGISGGGTQPAPTLKDAET
ncbi:DUF2061 domain-containing protein [Alteriqipengyuania lutimaris]|nr:DUF2061 domain-containing protein [Alteriqipengyuania lutimaris]